jgi:hypothetical protein
MREEITTLSKLIERLYRKPVYGSSIREEVEIINGKKVKVEKVTFYTSYPYDESKAIEVKFPKNRIKEKIEEIEGYCQKKDLALADVLHYCRENRIYILTEKLDDLERADIPLSLDNLKEAEPKTLKSIAKKLKEEMAEPETACLKEKFLFLHYAETPTGEKVVCGGGISPYPNSSDKLEEIPPEKMDKLKRITPWDEVVITTNEIRELETEEDEEYPGYDFEIKD